MINLIILILIIYSIIMTILFIYKNVKYHRMGDIALRLDDYIKLHEGKTIEEYLSIKDFVNLISDGSLSEETGHGGFIFEDDTEEPINWDFVRCVCSSVSKKYNQDCLCDIDKKHFKDACKEVEKAICEWKNSEESTVYEIRWIWENV